MTSTTVSVTSLLPHAPSFTAQAQKSSPHSSHFQLLLMKTCHSQGHGCPLLGWSLTRLVGGHCGRLISVEFVHSSSLHSFQAPPCYCVTKKCRVCDKCGRSLGTRLLSSMEVKVCQLLKYVKVSSARRNERKTGDNSNRNMGQNLSANRNGTVYKL